MQLNNTHYFSLRVIPQNLQLMCNREMATTDEIRCENLKILKEEAGGVGELASKISRSDSQVSQWLNGSVNSKTGKKRVVSSTSCRIIEAAFCKPVGWMDVQHNITPQQPAQSIAATTDEIVALLNAYGKLSRDQRKAAAAMIKGMAASSSTLTRLDGTDNQS